MAQGNNFLTIPEQEGLFTTTKSGRSGEDRSNCPEDEEDEEETEDSVRIMPRSSPVPRKRGHSINDETAEYMRIRLVLPPRRVSFADTTGSDLVDVREFVPFDSDDEDDARWEEEETKYHEAYHEPTFRLWPEFQPLTGTELTLAVRTNKVEVESLTPVPGEPLSFEGMIRVLNISFHKSVYVRSTMDGWISYFDYPSEYVQGSNDGDTDRFSFRLSFAEPYLFNGARIDFVVRYETSDGEFWANNSGRNYSVTLLKSYEDTEQVSPLEDVDIRGILKSPRYSVQDDYDFSQDKNGGDVASTEREAAISVPFPVCPPIVEPEIDLEITKVVSSSPTKTSGDSPPAECILPKVDAPYEQPLQDSAEISPQTDRPEIASQVTSSVQEVTETKLKVPENYPSPITDESEAPVKVHLDSDVILSAGFPSAQKEVEDVDENESEDVKEVRGHAEIQTETDGTKDTTQDEARNKVEEDKPEKSIQQCSFNEAGADSASKDEDFSSHDTLFGDTQYTREDECGLESVKSDAATRVEANRKEKMAINIKNVQAGGEEVGLVSACTGLGFGVTELGLTGGGPGSEEKELAGVLMVDVDTQLVSEDRALKEEILPPTPEDKGGGLSADKDKPVMYIEGKLFHDGPASFETPESEESQLSLSTKTSEVSSAHPNVLLGQSLIPSIAFFIAVVCLVVGFQEPSAFLLMALLLVFLCF
ncbi:uncharacterized protein LOC143512966 [Brachyhypopomus gauderio]|uniref:uncharacterized protein LOC143512966 n=1 Tax=Brachyhypopomus gauderio TaxID=698409 RepID=UPI00404207BC